MIRMLCNKCKRTPCEEGDTWCIGCSGWEALGQELCAKWSSAALRVVASDLVVHTVRTVRSLRQISSGISSASSAGVSRALETATPKSGTAPKPPLPRKESGGAGEVKAEPRGDESEYYTEESEEERPNPSLRPPEPDHPPPQATPVVEEGHREHRHKARGENRGEDRGRERQGHKRKRSGKRAGRKHQRQYRTLENPGVRLHRSKPGSYWDTTPSNQGRGALERRR